MALLEWKEGYSVGVAAVDFEHRELIDLINKLHEQLGAPGEATSITDFLGEIFARISAHFALEELEMREAGYAEYEAHKADHERLLDELRDLMDDHEDKGTINEIILARSLGDWFGIHFRTFDARLHQRLGH